MNSTVIFLGKAVMETKADERQRLFLAGLRQITDIMPFEDKVHELYENQAVIELFLLCYPINTDLVNSANEVGKVIEAMTNVCYKDKIFCEHLCQGISRLASFSEEASGQKKNSEEKHHAIREQITVDNLVMSVDIFNQLPALKMFCLKTLSALLRKIHTMKPFDYKHSEIVQIHKIFIANTKSPEIIMETLKQYYSSEHFFEDPFEAERQNQAMIRSRRR